MARSGLRRRLGRLGLALIVLSAMLLVSGGMMYATYPAQAQTADSGYITVTKLAPLDPTRDFDFAIDANPDPTTTVPEAPEWTFQLRHTGLYPQPQHLFPYGTYTISESNLDYWYAASIRCIDRRDNSVLYELDHPTVPAVTIELNADHPYIDCTFANSYDYGWLRVEKITGYGIDYQIPTVFEFDPDWSDTNFTLSSGQMDRSFLLRPGTYTVEELVEPGWAVNLVVCTLLDGSIVEQDTAGRSLTVTVVNDKDSMIDCRFYNQPTQTGRIVVDKVTSPASGPSFDFDASWLTGAQDFSVADTDTPVGYDLPIGTYSIDELSAFLWSLTEVSCTDQAGAPRGTISSTGASGLEIVDDRVITCVFTNTQDPHGTLTVTKTGGPDSGGSFHASTAGYSATFTLGPGGSWSSDVPPGDFAVTEDAITGWTPQASCTSDLVTGTFAPGSFSISDGEHVTCAFTNVRDTGWIRIVKQLFDPTDAWVDEAFEFDPSWSDSNITLPSAGPVWQTDLIPLETTEGIPGQAPYSVVELTPPANWSPGGASCVSDATSGQILPENIVLHKNETITCTFINDRAPTGSLTVVKDAKPGDDTEFDFTVGLGTNPPVARTLQDPSAPSALFTSPGHYTVTESSPLPDPWVFGDVTCTGAAVWSHQGQVLSVDVGRDEAVICTFRNEIPPGRIIVQKVISPASAPPATFQFVPSWGAGFALAGGGSADSGLLSAGVYAVSEALPLGEGWSSAGGSCDDGSAPTAIGVSPGETVTCTFFNRYQPPDGETPDGSLTIVKVTTPPGGAGFGFDAGALGAFVLDDGGLKTFDDLAAGSYSVSETAADGWELESVICSTAPGALVEYEASESGVVVELGEGQDVTCTFANREESSVGPSGSLTVIKRTVPGGGTGFDFDAGPLGAFTLDDGGSRTFTQLAAGTYVVTESASPEWQLAHIECDALDYSVAGASLTVNLAEGEVALCTFTNGGLPYTGSPPFTMQLLLVGLAGLVAGLGLWVWSNMREASGR